jgi:hypothetical protein
VKKIALLLALALSPTAARAEDAAGRMRDAARAIEPVRDVAKMTPAEQAALIAIARDPKQPVYARARAIGLVGALPNDAARALWRDARAWEPRELRVQAAWAQGLSVVKDEKAFAAFTASLLSDDEAHLREVAVQLLFVEGSATSVARAKQHATTETDPVVQQLLARRLRG